MPSSLSRRSRSSDSEPREYLGSDPSKLAAVDWGRCSTRASTPDSQAKRCTEEISYCGSRGPKARKHSRFRSRISSSSFGRRNSSTSSSRNGQCLVKEAESVGRESPQQATATDPERSFERERRGRGACRSRRRWRRIWRPRSWRIRFQEGHCSIDSHCESPCSERKERQNRVHLGRRQWLSFSFREQLKHFRESEEFCSLASSSENPSRRSRLHLPNSRSQLAERFSCSTSSTRRTNDSWYDSQRMAGVSLSSSTFPQSREMVLASCRDLGCFDSPETGRSSRKVRFAVGGCGTSKHRWRKLGAEQCSASGASTALPGLCTSSDADCSGTSAFQPLRPEMGGSLPGPPQRSGQLRGCQEEVEQRSKGREGERNTRKSLAQTKSESQRERGQGERQKGWRKCSPSGRGRRGQLSSPMSGSPRTAGPGALPQDDSQPAEIRVPGAAATTVHGTSVLQSMLRQLLKSRCRLGSFARSFVAQQLQPQHSRGTACSELFPMPLPYPEVLREKRNEVSQKLDARKKLLVCSVIVLNYLHLGRPHFFDKSLLTPGRMSKRQWEAVQHFGQLADAWLEHEPVTPEVMGRTAAKVESLEAVLRNLEEQVASLAKSGEGYFSPATSVRSQFEETLDVKQPNLGEMSSGSMSTFKPVDSSRLAFVGTPSFDPTPYLDPLSQAIFNDPIGMRQNPAHCTVKPPLLRVHCSRNEKIKLFDLLDQSDRLRFHTASEVCPTYGSGLFSVTKNLVKDRLILDSRGANLLEQPPGRWIRSLASAESVTRIMLEPQDNLLASGNDLTDFYYLFRATQSRSRRNVLVGGVHPKEVQHLRALKPEHLQEKVVFGALSSLAMGDTQAVELAQSCHLGLALQHGIVTSDNLTTMRKPPPRTDTTVGLVIDDFVTLSKVRQGHGQASEGALLAERMQDIYEEVKVIPNRKKGFRDEARSSFWGLDLDGERGLVRGSLKRAIPLAGLILKMVQLGITTTDLLLITSGSLISLLLFRRRLLSLLDSLFEATKGRGAREIFELKGRVKSDLLVLTILLPLACSNLRAKPATVFGASDASNWGEAGVVAKIPREIGKELTRHSLRKSVWVRLLKPAAAWMRAHELLPEADELPDEEEQIQTNPLWTLLACALEYKVLFAKEKTGSRHINVGELRATLKTEKILSLRNRSTRQLLGLDSQVVLGTLVKGRSSSAALNAELVKSLPWMLALDSYSEGFYFHTSMNRVDQPTRGKEVEPPSQDLPDWWNELASGNFRKFDEWLFEHGLDAESMSELPPLTELCGDVSPTGTLPYFLQCSESTTETVELAAGEALVETVAELLYASAAAQADCDTRSGPGEVEASSSQLPWAPCQLCLWWCEGWRGFAGLYFVSAAAQADCVIRSGHSTPSTCWQGTLISSCPEWWSPTRTWKVSTPTSGHDTGAAMASWKSRFPWPLLRRKGHSQVSGQRMLHLEPLFRLSRWAWSGSRRTATSEENWKASSVGMLCWNGRRSCLCKLLHGCAAAGPKPRRALW